MFKKYFLSIISLFTLINCGYVRIPEDKFGEPNLNEKVKYNFVEILSKEDLHKVDTTAYYIQIFEDRYYNKTEKENPQIMIFHNDGFFKSESLKYFEKFGNQRNKNSIYYGGKYRIKGNIIELEQFYPSKGGKTKYFVRNISKGKIDGNKIFFSNKESLVTVFERKQKLK